MCVKNMAKYRGGENMKKKLFLLPFVLFMTATVTGCDIFKVFRREPEVVPDVYINDWLEAAKNPAETPNCAEFYFKGEEENNWSYDYDLKVRDMIQKIDFPAGEKIDGSLNDKTEENVHYVMRYTHVSKLEYCDITIFKDGVITTAAHGGGGKLSVGVKSQYFRYCIAPDYAAELVDNIIARYYEIKEGIAGERELAREASSFTNFFASIEETSYYPTINYQETREHYDLVNYTVVDNGRAILEQLKEIEFTPLADNYTIDLVPMIKYYIHEEWVLEMYCGWGKADCDVVCMRYRYDETNYQTYYHRNYCFYYSLDPVKGEAVADAVRAIHG